MKLNINNSKNIYPFNAIIAPYDVMLRSGNALLKIGRGSFSSVFNIIISRSDLLPAPSVVCVVGQYTEFNRSSRVICGYSEHINHNRIINTFSNSLHLRKKIDHVNQDLELTKIGSNVILSQNSLVLQGSNIGDNSLIGANCLVKNHIEENSLIVGVPGKVLRRLTPPTTKWWNLKESEIIKYHNNQDYSKLHHVPVEILMTADLDMNSMCTKFKS